MTAEQVMYFGRPGFLVEIPHARRSNTTSRTRPRTLSATVGGGARHGQVVGGKRTFSYSWGRLMAATFDTLERYDSGAQGPGPFALLDPSRVNMLTVNQAAATSETNDTSNFTVSGSGAALASEFTTVDLGPRSLRVNFTYAASGAVTLDSPDVGWPGIPLVVGKPYTFWLTAKGGGTDAVMTVTAQIAWYDVNGAALSTSSGTPVVTDSSTFQVVYVTATAPASTAYGLCSFTVTGTSAGSVLYGGRFQLQRDTGAAPTAADWYTGTGVYPVGCVSLTDGWAWAAPDYHDNPVWVLQELGV